MNKYTPEYDLMLRHIYEGGDTVSVYDINLTVDELIILAIHHLTKKWISCPEHLLYEGSTIYIDRRFAGDVEVRDTVEYKSELTSEIPVTTLLETLEYIENEGHRRLGL